MRPPSSLIWLASTAIVSPSSHVILHITCVIWRNLILNQASCNFNLWHLPAIAKNKQVMRCEISSLLVLPSNVTFQNDNVTSYRFMLKNKLNKVGSNWQRDEKMSSNKWQQWSKCLVQLACFLSVCLAARGVMTDWKSGRLVLKLFCSPCGCWLRDFTPDR